MYFILNIGKVFNVWDTIFSWNRWAVDWSYNQFPALTYEYPQILPANWSLSYVIMQNKEVQAFTKAIMSLFSLFTILLFFDLARIKKNLVYLIGAILYGVILYSLYRKLITSGYMDIPILFFAFLSFYIIILNNKEKYNIKNIILITIFGCTAVMIKQTGLIILFFIIIYDIWYFYKAKANLSKRNYILSIALLLIIILVVIAPWYAMKEIQIATGDDLSNIKYVTHDIYEGKSLIQRAYNTVQKYFIGRSIIEKFLSVIIFIILFFGLFKKESRWILIFFIYPYFLIWIFFFSYDHRNLAIAIPFIAYSAAFGLYFILEKINKYWPNLKKFVNFKLLFNFKCNYLNIRKLNMIFIISFLLAVSILSFTIKGDLIVNQQHNLQRKLGYQNLNNLIYEYRNEKEIKGQIITDYWFLGLFPEFKDSAKRIAFPRVDCNSNILLIFYDSDPSEKINDATEYLLLSDRINKKIIEKINNKIEDGEYNLIFESEEFNVDDQRLEKYKFVRIK